MIMVRVTGAGAGAGGGGGETTGPLSFGIGFVDRIPILRTVAVVITLIGVTYYLAVGRRQQFAPLIAPAGDDEPPVTGAPAAGQAPSRGCEPLEDKPATGLLALTPR